MKIMHQKQNGFSLPEALIALAIGGTFLTSVLTMWSSSAKILGQQGVESKLHYAMETAIERLKYDVRMADGNNILFYPANASTYTAISMPSPVRDANGFLSFNVSGGVNWSRTVVYHVYHNPSTNKDEMRLTIIPSFDTNAVSRQTELDAIVSNGNNGGNGTTRVLFSGDSVMLTMSPQSPSFDGYNAAAERSDNIVFGSLRLTSGNHTIRFQVTDKNALSTGYIIGLDQIALTPSGAPLEVEALTESDNGRSVNTEDMSAISPNLWGGNTQIEYGSSSVGDYIEFTTNYDRWLESNFADMTFQNATVVNNDPALTILSRESAALSAAWLAQAQTGSAAQNNSNLTNDHTVRSVVQGADISKTSTMIRVKFTASNGSHLAIDNAYFGERSSANNKGMNFANAPTQLYFDNAPVQEGAVDGAGAVGNGTATAADITADHHIWSNWFTYSLDPTKDYIVSYHVTNNSSSGAASWNDAPNIHSYEIHDGAGVDYASSGADLTAIPGLIIDSNNDAVGVSEISAWTHTGTATSQVYDTKMTNPNFTQLAWNSVLPAGSSVTMKARGGSMADLSDAPAWTAVAGSNSSPMGVGSLAGKRYVQFQATMTAGNPYTNFPTVDNVDLTWPGQTSLVEISGHITKRPNYGKFKVLVDGKAPINALKVSLDANDTFRGKNYAYTMATQVNPKNTGK